MSEWEDWAKDDEAWADADQVANEMGGGEYLSLSDGDKVQVVFKGKPYAFKTVWMGDHSEIYDEVKHDGESPRARFMFAVAYRRGDKGKYQPALFESSGTTYATIKKALKKHGSKNTYELEREGSDMKTKYHCLYDHALEGAELEHVAGLDFPSPEESVAAKADASVGPGPAPEDLPEAGDPFDDIPF